MLVAKLKSLTFHHLAPILESTDKEIMHVMLESVQTQWQQSTDISGKITFLTNFLPLLTKNTGKCVIVCESLSERKLVHILLQNL
eukprot:Pgem_evm1s10732